MAKPPRCSLVSTNGPSVNTGSPLFGTTLHTTVDASRPPSLKTKAPAAVISLISARPAAPLSRSSSIVRSGVHSSLKAIRYSAISSSSAHGPPRRLPLIFSTKSLASIDSPARTFSKPSASQLDGTSYGTGVRGTTAGEAAAPGNNDGGVAGTRISRDSTPGGAVLVGTGVGGPQQVLADRRVVNRSVADALDEHDMTPGDIDLGGGCGIRTHGNACTLQRFSRSLFIVMPLVLLGQPGISRLVRAVALSYPCIGPVGQAGRVLVTSRSHSGLGPGPGSTSRTAPWLDRP